MAMNEDVSLDGDATITEIQTIPSSELQGNPGQLPNDFVPVEFITNKIVYDPSYIFKFKNPNMHALIDKINELCIAVTDLQQVVTDLVNNDLVETRNVMNDTVWSKVKECCRELEISYSPDNLSSAYNKQGVLEEGIDPYTCHIQVKK